MSKKSNKNFSFLDSLQAFSLSFINQSLANLLAFLYILWRFTMTKKSNKRKSVKSEKSFSQVAREFLEFKKVNEVIGVNIVIILLIFALLQNFVGFTHAKSDQYEQFQLKTKVSILTETTFRIPVIGYISQFYNWFHPGIDIAGNENQPIYPITSGKVMQIQYSRFGYGINIVVDHGNNVVSRYAHLKAVSVEIGQDIDKNTVLGYVGSTGWSTGPHLHLEIFIDGETVNPMAVLPGDYSSNYVNLNAKAVDENLITSAQEKMNLSNESTSSSHSSNIVYKEKVENFEEPQAYKYVATNSAEISVQASGSGEINTGGGVEETVK